MNERAFYHTNGYLYLRSFFDEATVAAVREDAKAVFVKQMRHRGLLPADEVSEQEFEKAMYQFFSDDIAGFMNCGKACQHLISLHQLSLSQTLVAKLRQLGINCPNICTRPVIFFNASRLAKSESFYKVPPIRTGAACKAP